MNGQAKIDLKPFFTSRQQATEKAIEKAITLYNEKFKEN